jgi:hypothetical protein
MVFVYFYAQRATLSSLRDSFFRWRLVYSSTFAREPPPASSAAPAPFAALAGLLPGGRAAFPEYSQGFGGPPLGLTAVFQEVVAASPPERPNATLANQVRRGESTGRYARKCKFAQQQSNQHGKFKTACALGGVSKGLGIR